MRLVRLGEILALKYKAAADLNEIFRKAKRDILTNYHNWVMARKYHALQTLAEIGEPYAQKLYGDYNDLVRNIDTFTPQQVFNRLNKILAFIKEMKNDPKKQYRHSIHDAVIIERETDRNFREALKGGFETNLLRISFGLEKVAKMLRPFFPGEEIEGGVVEPQRKELSKEKLLMFMRTPGAQKYGLDSMDVLGIALSDPEMRDKITTLINAIDRGHVPADGHTVMTEAKFIRNWIDQRTKTNVSALEGMPEKAPTTFEPEKPVSPKDFEDEE
jgi:hypothetical protein